MSYFWGIFFFCVIKNIFLPPFKKIFFILQRTKVYRQKFFEVCQIEGIASCQKKKGRRKTRRREADGGNRNCMETRPAYPAKMKYFAFDAFLFELNIPPPGIRTPKPKFLKNKKNLGKTHLNLYQKISKTKGNSFEPPRPRHTYPRSVKKQRY